jgi:nucleotide-binding universal stress UspA family protein
MLQEAKRLAARWERSHAQAEQRRVRAQEFARALARDLALVDPSVRMIVGFGSTFESWRQYRKDSDIDLALRGGDWGTLWSLIPRSEFAVSLVELDLQPDAFVEQVCAQGVVLYEKQ